MRPPIPTFLIPLMFVRWLVPKLFRMLYPYFLLLNERFESTPFAERVNADTHGFYAAVANTVQRMPRHQSGLAAGGTAAGHESGRSAGNADNCGDGDGSTSDVSLACGRGRRFVIPL